MQTDDTDHPAPPAGAAEPATASLRDLGLRNDALQREVAKWTKMYDDLREGQGRTEARLRDRVEELRRNVAAAQNEASDLRRRLERTEENYRKFVEAAQASAGEEPGGEWRTSLLSLMESHAELSRSYDTLVRELEQKDATLAAMTKVREETEAMAKAEVQRMEAYVKQERELAALSRSQHAELEQAYHQMVRSYRDMNDRFIQLHQRKAAEARRPAGPGPGGTS